MSDILGRIINHPLDYRGIIRSRKITFLERIDEGGETYSFVFKAPEGVVWKAGQHAVFSFLKSEVAGKNWRAFSVASSCHEGVIRFSTHVCAEPSEFKKKLLQLTSGDTMKMRGPYGEFHVGKVDQVVAVAGGIGITPFRSIACEIFNGHIVDTKFDLVYAGKGGLYPFHDDWKEYEKHPDINVTYVNTPDEVNMALDDRIESYGNNASYFVSGSPGMVKALRNKLEGHGLTKVVSDPFEGY